MGALKATMIRQHLKQIWLASVEVPSINPGFYDAQLCIAGVDFH